MSHVLKRPRSKFTKSAAPEMKTPMLLTDKQEIYFKWTVAAILFVFSTFITILYYGYQVMPTSDMPAFLSTGRAVLSGHLPGDFKRGPVLGIMQILLSYLVGGQYPELTAGYLLNCMVYPVIVVLMWFLGRSLIGNSAVWIAVLAAANPWMIRMLQDPIAETVLLFFILITYFFIFRKSRWAYVLGAVASMLRYECVALILAAFVVDIIEHKHWRQRLAAFGCMVIASLPFAFWMAETMLHWQSQSATHYLKVFTPEYAKLLKDIPGQDRTGLLKNCDLIWQVGFAPLLMASPDAGQGVSEFLEGLSKFLLGVGFILGVARAFWKKNWNIVALLIFMVPYTVVHSRYPYLMHRYYHCIFWMAAVIAFYGLRECWIMLRDKSGMPGFVIKIIQGLVIIVAAVWLVELAPWLPRIEEISPKSAVVPLVASLGVVAIAIAFFVFYQGRAALTTITATLLVCVMLASNQFSLVNLIGDGQREAEFKDAATWYLKNGKPPGKMGLFLSNMVQIYLPSEMRQYVSSLPIANNKAEFVKMCRNTGIEYVVWASREGFMPNNEYYQLCRLDNIEQLKNPATIGPYEFITTLSSKHGYLNIFRLKQDQK